MEPNPPVSVEASTVIQNNLQGDKWLFELLRKH